MSLQYWYMLPVSIIIATIATASGVGGATFFAPLFMLALRIPPEVAVGAGAGGAVRPRRESWDTW